MNTTKNTGKAVTPINLLRSWCQAVGLTCHPPRTSDASLTVEGPKGMVDVLVAFARCGAAPESVLVVMASELTNVKLAVALGAFHAVTEAVGIGKPLPFDRGEEPAKKMSYKEDPFMVAIRHRELRRAPNPPASKWAFYRPTMEKCSWEFLRRNSTLAYRSSFNYDDALQIARLCLPAFCARYELVNPKKPEENLKLFHVYLRQRFTDLVTTLTLKALDTTPDHDTVAASRDNEETVYDPRTQEQAAPDARRAEAIEQLEEAFDILGHDVMVAKLNEAIEGDELDPDAKRAAIKWLNKHAADCDSCQVVAEEDEESAGTDSDSTKE